MALPSPLRQRKLTWIVEIGEIPPYRTGPYEVHLNHSKNEREDVQKKTFAKWINSQLAKHGKPLVEDLFQDLRDGEVLLSLLEILTDQHLKRERGRMRVHQLNNVNCALRALASAGVRLVNISSGDIVDGNPKLVLGLVWSIILHWQVHYHLKELMSELQQTNLEKTLLAWCRTHTQNYSDVNVSNFTTSWSDGLAFNALLHRFRPHLFDFSELRLRPAAERLEHAFALAQKHLFIDRLLDPEDVNTPNPDKKSIMMYVMCLFQSLPHCTDDVAQLDAANGDSLQTDNAEGGSESVAPSRPLSCATTCSVELGAYGGALEEALTALLDGEERLAAHTLPDPSQCPHPGQHLANLKEHFHTHEKFLLELSEQQCRVGAVLEEGARLIRDAALSKDESNEVRLQMRLLNERWEQLRVSAMERQSAIHAELMRAQHEYLNTFRQWLTATEDRMSHMEAEGGEDAESALTAARQLHADLRTQQPLVDALADCVVVVDDDHEHDKVTEIEDQLRALGERWSHACQWTLDRLQRAQDAYALHTTSADLYRAADTLEQDLKQMEANPASEIGEVISRIGSLQRCKQALKETRAALVQHLQQVQLAGVEGQLSERGEELHDRLDALEMILQVQLHRIRDLGFELDLTDEPPVSNATSTSVTVFSHEQKKPRLERAGDFQAGYRAFESWADNAEKALKQCKEKLESECAARDREQILSVVQRVQKESEEQRTDFANVEEIQIRLAADTSLREEAQRHSESIEALKRRWEEIQRGLTDIRNAINLLEDKDSFYRNLRLLQTDLQDVSTWRDRTQSDKPSNNHLIHLRNKMRLMRQLQIKLKELNAQSIILLTKPIPKCHKDYVETDTKRINEEFEELYTYLSKREVEVKLAINKKPLETNEDEHNMVQRRIQDMEGQIIAEHAIISSKEEMEKRLVELKRLQINFEEIQSSYDKVVREKKQYERGSVEELNLRSSLENLVTRFTDSKTILEQKIQKLQRGIELLDTLEKESNEVKVWVQQVQQFVDKYTTVPLGDVTALEKILIDSNNLDEDKPKYRSKLDNIESIKNTILEDCDEMLSKSLKTDTKELLKRFNEVTTSSFKLNESLRRGLEKTEGIFRNIDNVEQWLQDIENEIPKEDECTIRDSGELYQMKTRFQTLKDKCDDKTEEFRGLNEAGNDILLVAEGGASGLARRLTHLNAVWTRVTHAIYERYKVLAEAWHESGELRAWLAQQAAWLDGLQRRLRTSPARADAEEISDELYDLENYMANRSEERVERIEAIGRQLIEAHIMPGWIQHELDTITARWNTLREQAAARASELEAAASEAARSEVALDNLHQWAGAVRRTTPPTRLAAELLVHRQALVTVQAQVEVHRDAGRQEAASRLFDQLKLAQGKLDEIEEQFLNPRQEETPARVEEKVEEEAECSRVAARLEAASSALREVQQDAAELALTGAEPDAVRAQLRRCLRFYRTLSEIKSEVESIIKTGRKMVEEKAVPEPNEFSKKIDTLKELYNKLGAHVTESKTRLETALLSAREIQNDLQTVTNWLQGLSHVGQQTLELEMSRMEAIKDKLNGNYVQFTQICDPVYLENLRDQIEEINNRWTQLKRHGLSKRDVDAETMQKYLNDVERQLDGSEPLSATKLSQISSHLRAKATDVEALDNKALSNHWTKITEKVAAKQSKDDVIVEYENVTDTIKRRLESPINSPDVERPEFKKSKIPLALKSPVPVKKEIQEGGNRSRGSSLERRVKKDDSSMSESIISTMSVDSIEGSISASPSLPSTPGTPKKDSSTFNLLKDSDLFTQISKNRIETKPAVEIKKSKDSCQVVAVTEHEIMKSTVSPIEPMEIYPSDTVETVVEFIPQTVETVEIIYDTEGESAGDSDDEKFDNEKDHGRRSVDLGSEPKTFVVEVRKFDERMKPTLGILKHRSSSEEKKKTVTVNEIPDLIPSNDNDVSMKTPPPTPMDESEAQECPLLYDLVLRQKEAQKNLMRDEVNEYLILDEVPKELAALPEPSATETMSGEAATVVSNKGDDNNSTEQAATVEKPVVNEDDVIYSEVEDMNLQQVRLSSADFEEKRPKATSTPIKEEKKPPVQVVAMSPKSQENQDSSFATEIVTSEKYQRTDDYAQVSEKSEPEVECEEVPTCIRSRFGSACDGALEQFELDAQKMARRLHVMLLTLGGVSCERDPAKRLEILKNQLGAIAPDAAALISRGDSLVYETHAHDPALAAHLQAHLTDRLRDKWALVISEIELKRNAAIKAEDDVKELTVVIDRLRSWLKDFHADTNRTDIADAENDYERVQELVRDLRAQKVAFPERAAADVTTAFCCARDKYETTIKKDKKGKDTESADAVTRINRARELVASVSAALRSHPLGGRDFDDFPLQEDALARIKSSMAEANIAVEEAENARRRCAAERVRRVADKLRDEWAALQSGYQDRYERWSNCQSKWARLYAALESGGEKLDAIEQELDEQPTDIEKLKQLQERVCEATRGASETHALGRGVVRACSGALARDILEQLDAVRQRAGAAQQRVSRALCVGRASHAVREVKALLLSSSANPSDRTTLAVRLSLVKAREEELAASARELQSDNDRSRALTTDLQQAQEKLSAHGEYVRSKLAALDKYTARLEAALTWAMETRARLALPKDLADARPDDILTSINEHETEMREVLENYKNLERECAAARQTVSPELRERVLRLRTDWDHIRACADNERGSRGGSRRRSSQGPPASAALLATFDTSVQQIRDWVSVEVDMLRAQPVAVGDVDDILQQLDKQKGVLRELEQKKPQLDELLHTAESLKGTENRQQLHGKGEF
ncbi:unnamed protein product [Leptosia nina]|uniref:Calponin-homology (CH) domain-containing protein n=1 Tax=Leptosia nina TaxID=320188 RepID=A0AAV1JBY1_9NEOP